MEQKTEASQAVDELSPTIVDEDGLPMAIAGVLRSKGDIVSLATLYMLIDAWGEKQRNHARAALKAQPAPTPASVPVMYQQRMVAPDGNTGPWREANLEMYQRYSANQDIGDGFKYEVRALCAAQPSGNTGEFDQVNGTVDMVMAQGEDSARLDAVLMKAREWIIKNHPSLTLSRTKTIDEYMGLLDIIDRARASAETGGVKP